MLPAKHHLLASINTARRQTIAGFFHRRRCCRPRFLPDVSLCILLRAAVVRFAIWLTARRLAALASPAIHTSLITLLYSVLVSSRVHQSAFKSMCPA
jgi:hypothetical protein